MKIFKTIDLALQAVLSLMAFLALLIDFGAAFYLFIAIGIVHITSNILSLIVYPSNYRFYKEHLWFFFSVGLVALMFLCGLVVKDLLFWAACASFVGAFIWYPFYTVLTIREYQHWRDVETQQSLTDLGH